MVINPLFIGIPNINHENPKRNLTQTQPSCANRINNDLRRFVEMMGDEKKYGRDLNGI
jgi:hypothetical protein